MGPLFGWAGNILKVDLSTATIQTIDTERYVPKYLGGKGLIHRIAWDEIPRGTGAFDPDNRLILAVGPLTGTPAPTSGRAEIGGVAPQSNPEMYSHSGIGGRIGAELKYAGFDAIIIHGKASKPCYLWINDGICEIKDASQLWGLSTYSTQLELQNIHGKNITSLTIGPAGEHESRIAVLITGSHNAAGQGGFGGVAGSKNLKAISIKGSKNVRIACPDKLLGIRRNISKPQYKNPLTMESKFEYDGHLVDGRLFRKFHTACSHACDRYCVTALMGIPESTRPGVHDIKVPCVSPMAIGWLHGEPWKDEQLIDWPLWSQGFKGGLETLELLNQYGLNMYEILAGMVPWIVMAAHEGVLTENDFGFPIDPNNTEWWVSLLRMITFKEGFGEILAEGTTRAIDMLGKEKYGNTIYTGIRTLGGRQAETPISLQQAWGYAEHWSGRGLHSSLPYPEWLLRALTWMTQSRDSNNDTHHRDRAEWMDEFYTNPYRGSIGPWMAIWDEHRSELKCSLTLCDRVFPMPYYSSVEAELFSAVTGQDIAEDELDKIGERLKNLQRAILIRNHNRSRDVETGEILPFFKRPDGTKGISIDEHEFNIMIDNYYEQRGWDKTNGWPTRKKLEELDLKNIADELQQKYNIPIKD